MSSSRMIGIRYTIDTCGWIIRIDTNFTGLTRMTTIGIIYQWRIKFSTSLTHYGWTFIYISSSVFFLIQISTNLENFRDLYSMRFVRLWYTDYQYQVFEKIKDISICNQIDRDDTFEKYDLLREHLTSFVFPNTH